MQLSRLNISVKGHTIRSKGNTLRAGGLGRCIHAEIISMHIPMIVK